MCALLNNQLIEECGRNTGTFYIYAVGAASRDNKQAEEIMPLKDS